MLCLLSMPVLAHAPIDGIDGFWLGMRHPFTVPAQALGIVSLGLWLGWARPQVFRRAWGAFNLTLITALAGLLTGLLPRWRDASAGAVTTESLSAGSQTGSAAPPAPDPFGVPLLVLALLVALCAAVRPRWVDLGHGMVATGAAALIGGALAWGTAPEPGATSALTMTVGGSLFVLDALLLVLFGVGDALRRPQAPPWTRIALRVLAAWLVAVAMLVLALHLAD